MYGVVNILEAIQFQDAEQVLTPSIVVRVVDVLVPLGEKQIDKVDTLPSQELIAERFVKAPFHKTLSR